MNVNDDELYGGVHDPSDYFRGQLSGLHLVLL